MTQPWRMFVIAVTICSLASSMISPASAITVELAKKCRDMAIKAHPYQLPGVKGPGTAAAERDYYNDCIAKDGNMSSAPVAQPANPKPADNGQTPSQPK